MGEAQSQPGHGGKNKNLCSLRELNPDSPVARLYTSIPTGLNRILRDSLVIIWDSTASTDMMTWKEFLSGRGLL
jgi:hypothetical protein